MKKKIILVGGGSHANSCAELIEQENMYSIQGIIDEKKPGKGILQKYKYLGGDLNLIKLNKSVKFAIVTIGHIDKPLTRKKLFEKIEKLNFKVPVITSPLSLISKNSKIGIGTMIFHNVIINSNVEIGENCIINNKALIEHDVEIGDNSHISTGCLVNGSTKIGSNTFIGSGSIIKNNITVGNNCFIRLGPIVSKNIPNNSRF